MLDSIKDSYNNILLIILLSVKIITSKTNITKQEN